MNTESKRLYETPDIKALKLDIDDIMNNSSDPFLGEDDVM